MLVVLDGNYGQQAAILCGLEHIGPCRVYGTIDDDLEQPPHMLKELYGCVMDGCDLAYGIADYGGQPEGHEGVGGGGCHGKRFFLSVGCRPEECKKKGQEPEGREPALSAVSKTRW